MKDQFQTYLPNRLLDECLPEITPSALKVITYITRHTVGRSNRFKHATLKEMEIVTGLSKKTLMSAIKLSVDKGWIEQIPEGKGFKYAIAERFLTDL